MSALHDEAKRLAVELISMGGANVHINQAADTLLNLAHAASRMEVMRDAALNVAEANAKSGATWAARVQELEAQLEAIGAGGVEPLRQPATDAARAEMLAVLREVDECSAYWSEYDVPVGLHARIKAAINKVESV